MCFPRSGLSCADGRSWRGVGRARTSTSPKREYPAVHPYVFKSLVYCGLCSRRMQGHRSHGRTYYRCRYSYEYATANGVTHPRNVTLPEEPLINPLDRWLALEFSATRREQTLGRLLAQIQAAAPLVGGLASEPDLSEYDAQLDRYRALLDAGADPAVVANWISETQAARKSAKQRHAATSRPKDDLSGLTAQQLAAIIDEIGDLSEALKEAEPEHKQAVYRSLGLKLIYSPDTKTVRAEIDLAAHRWSSVCVRRATREIFTPSSRHASWRFHRNPGRRARPEYLAVRPIGPAFGRRV